MDITRRWFFKAIPAAATLALPLKAVVSTIPPAAGFRFPCQGQWLLMGMVRVDVPPRSFVYLSTGPADMVRAITCAFQFNSGIMPRVMGLACHTWIDVDDTDQTFAMWINRKPIESELQATLMTDRSKTIRFVDAVEATVSPLHPHEWR